MAAVVPAGCDEIHRVGLLRDARWRRMAAAPASAIGRRRQAGARIGIVGSVGAQIRAVQLAVVARRPVRRSRSGSACSRMPMRQRCRYSPAILRQLLRHAAFLLDDGRHDQQFVGVLQRQSQDRAPARPPASSCSSAACAWRSRSRSRRAARESGRFPAGTVLPHRCPENPVAAIETRAPCPAASVAGYRDCVAAPPAYPARASRRRW